MDLRPSLEAALDAFAPSVTATVTLPGDDPVEDVRVFWLPPSTVEVPAGAELRRADPRRVLVVPSAAVPQVPRGTLIAVSEQEGEAPLEWRVDSTERTDPDHHRVVVVPNE